MSIFSDRQGVKNHDFPFRKRDIFRKAKEMKELCGGNVSSQLIADSSMENSKFKVERQKKYHPFNIQVAYHEGGFFR